MRSPAPTPDAPPLDILFVGSLPPRQGGSAVSASLILGGLADAGHRVRALAPATAESLRDGDSYAAANHNIEVSRYLMPYLDATAYAPANDDYRRLEAEQVTACLHEIVAAGRPDVVFISRETFAWYVPEVARAYGLPCLLRVAGAATMGLVNGNYPADTARSLLEQLGRVERLITPAHHLQASLEQLGVRNVQTILNAVDLRRFYPAPPDPVLRQAFAIDPDDIVVAYVANLKTRKRPFDLIEAAARVLESQPNFVFLVIGDGPLRAAMEAAVAHKEIAGAFRFTGWLSYDRMPAVMNLADLVVMPSEAEGLARVYLEAMACGRVLIASDIPPAREVIAEGETGLLFSVGDVATLSEQLLRVAGDEALRRQVGLAARAQMKAHALDTAVKAYTASLTELIADNRAGPTPADYRAGH